MGRHPIHPRHRRCRRQHRRCRLDRRCRGRPIPRRQTGTHPRCRCSRRHRRPCRRCLGRIAVVICMLCGSNGYHRLHPERHRCRRPSPRKHTVPRRQPPQSDPVQQPPRREHRRCHHRTGVVGASWSPSKACLGRGRRRRVSTVVVVVGIGVVSNAVAVSVLLAASRKRRFGRPHRCHRPSARCLPWHPHRCWTTRWRRMDRHQPCRQIRRCRRPCRRCPRTIAIEITVLRGVLGKGIVDVVDTVVVVVVVVVDSITVRIARVVVDVSAARTASTGIVVVSPLPCRRPRRRRHRPHRRPRRRPRRQHLHSRRTNRRPRTLARTVNRRAPCSSSSYCSPLSLASTVGRIDGVGVIEAAGR